MCLVSFLKILGVFFEQQLSFLGEWQNAAVDGEKLRAVVLQLPNARKILSVREGRIGQISLGVFRAGLRTQYRGGIRNNENSDHQNNRALSHLWLRSTSRIAQHATVS